jgi:serine/threonine-protein kinase
LSLEACLSWYRPPVEAEGPYVLGRYALFDELASGGMATVHYARLVGDAGFARTVVVKRLHRQLAKDPEVATMFLDEARLASRIRHPNVVQTLDVVEADGELFLVMELILGEALHRILRAAANEGRTVPLDVTSAIICSVLHGLHAAHEATSDRGEPLAIVHRDVSPSNVLVGADGIVRVIDFGVAKAANRAHTTRDGAIKGKLSYMSPEQLHGEKLDRRADVFATGIILWELLAGRPLFHAETEAATMTRIFELQIDPPSTHAAAVPRALDQVVLRALKRTAAKRFPTARAMALEIEAIVPPASASRVAAWVEEIAGELLEERARTLARIEQQENPKDPGPPPGSRLGGAPAEEAATLAGSTTMRDPRPARRDILRWGSYAAVALAAGTVGVLAARSRGPSVRADVVSAGGPSSNVTSAGASANVEEPPPLSLSPSLSPSLAPSFPPATPAASKPSAPTRAPRHRPPAPPATTKPACTPSYVDENGIKQYRSCP